MIQRWALAVLAPFLLWTLTCGYHVGGQATTIPKSIQTIAIPPFTSITTDPQISDMLPNAIGREFTERTRFRVVVNPQDADAVLTGTINRVIRAPQLFDPTTGKTTSVQLIVIVSVTLKDRASGKVLFSRPNWNLKDNYELATDPHQLFDESGSAMNRLSQTFARDIVSAIVEDF